MSRVWKIDEDGDLCLYVDGEPLYGTAWFLDKDAAAELRPILERGQADGDLPEGVHRAPDGTLLCKPKDLPNGWQFWSHAAEDWMKTGPLFPDRYHEVRPVQPATERVEAWEALRDRRVVLIPGGTNHLDLSGEDRTEQQRIGALACSGAVGADGLVEVLVEP